MKRFALPLLALGMLLLLPLGVAAQVALPFDCDFSQPSADGQWTLVNGSNANAWAFGTAASEHMGDRALYISNNGGATNTYSNNSVSYSWAYVDVNLTTPGQYYLDFDWVANGEGSWDYMRVFLVPQSATLSSSSLPNNVTSTNSFRTTEPSGWRCFHSSGTSFVFNGTTTWRHSTETFTIGSTETGQWKLAFLWVNDGSSGSTPPAAIDNVSFGQETCPKPTGLAVSNVGSNGMTLSWNAGSDASAWSVYVDGIWRGSTTTPSFNITGLNPNTVYSLGVRAICSASDSSAREVFSARTACGVIATPVTMDFEEDNANAVPLCWTPFGTGVKVGSSSSSAHGGTKYLLFQGALSMLVAAPQTQAPLNTLQARFWAKPINNLNANCGSLEVGYVTNLTDGGSFVAVETFPYNSFTAYEEREVLMSGAPVGAILAFRNVAGSTSFGWYVDDVTLEPMPSCKKVRNLEVTAVDDGSATLVWTDTINNPGVTYSIYNGSTLLASGISATTYICTGLAANTVYTLSVVADCSASEASDPVSTSFRTACAPTQPLPYADDFESYATNRLPDCWSRQGWYGTSADYIYPIILSNSGWAHSGNQYLNMYYMASGSTVPQYAITPLLEGNDLHVRFWLSIATVRMGETFMAGIMTDNNDTNTFIPLLTIDGGTVANNSYHEYEFYTDVENLPDNIYVAFRMVTTNNNNMRIDDLLIEQAPACRLPINPTVSAIDYQGATLSWSASAGSNQLVRYGRVNNVNSSANHDTVVTGANRVTLAGLEGNKAYFAWVATLCEGDTTDWVPFTAFATDQDCYPVVNAHTDIVTLNSATVVWDYNEDHGREATGVDIAWFDILSPQDTTFSHSTGTTAFLTHLEPSHTYMVIIKTECESYESSAAVVTFSTLDCGKLDGGSSWMFGAFSGFSGYGYSQTLYPGSVLDAMDTVTGIQFSIYSRATASPYRTVDIYMANTDLEDLDATRILDSADFVKVATGKSLYVGSAGWKTINFDVPFINDHGRNVVVAVVNRTGNASSNEVRFMWNSHAATMGAMVCWNEDSPISMANPSVASASRYDKVPDIIFNGSCDLSGCRAPLLAASDVTDVSVKLAWAPINGETAWVVQHRRTADTVWTSVDSIVTDTTYLFENLNAATGYVYRVGSVCGSDTVFSDEVSIHTRCGEMVFPYREGFEEWGSALFPACWNRVQTSTSSNKTYPYVIEDSAYSHSGGKAMAFYGSGNAPNILASGEVPLASNAVHVEFWAKLQTTNLNQVLQAGLMTDLSDPNSFVPVLSLQGALDYTHWQMFEFYTDSINLDSEHLYVAFRSYNTSSYGTTLYVDDVVINEAHNCRRPVAGSVDSYTYNTASFSWTPSSALTADFTVRLTHSFSTEDDNAVSQEVNGTMATVGGLDFATEYHAWVAARCGDVLTDWFYLGSFTTDEICAPVENLEVSSLSTDAATLSWSYDAQHGQGPSGVVVVVENLLDTTAEAEYLYSSTNGIIVSALEPGTTYRATVQTLCGGLSSRLLPSVVFTTQTCAMAEGTGQRSSVLPLREGSNVYHSYTQMLYPDTLVANMDTIKGVAFRVYGGGTGRNHPVSIDLYIGNTDRTYLTTTTGYVPASMMQKVADNYSLDINREGWMIIPFDSVFIPGSLGSLVVAMVGNYTETFSSGLEWYTHSGGYNTALTYYNSSLTTAIDVEQLPSGSKTTYSTVPDVMFIGPCSYDSCPPVSAVVDETGTDFITVSWISSEGSDHFVAEYLDTAGQWVSDTTESFSYTFFDLQPSTNYALRIGRLCSVGIDSVRVVYTDLSAYTQCVAVEVPFVYDFTAPELGPCWQVSGSGVRIDASSHSLAMDLPGQYVILPEMVLMLDEVQLTLNFSLNNLNHSFVVGFTEDNGATITWIDTLHVATTNTPTETVTHFLNYSGGPARIVIANGANTYYTYLDALRIDSVQLCLPVEEVEAMPFVSSATLLWDYEVDDLSFEVQYKGTGDDDWSFLTVDSTMVRIDSLTPSTAYIVRVRPICDTGRWTMVEFSTLCEAASLPLVERFDVLAGSQSMTQALSCWSFREGVFQQVADGTTPLLPANYNRWSSVGGQIDGYGLQLQVFGDINTVSHWAVMPAVVVDDSTALIAFDYKVVPANLTSVPDNDDRFLIAATTDGIHWQRVASWGSNPQVDTFSFAAPWNTVHHAEVPIASFYGDTVRFAFYGESLTPSSNFNLYIDNLRIGHQECIIPTAVSATANATEVTLTFVAQHEVEVAIVEGQWYDSAAVAIPVGTASSFTFEGLQPSTTYSIGVRQECEPGYYSDWAVRIVDMPEPPCQTPSAVAFLTIDSLNESHNVTWTPEGDEQLWQVHFWGASIDTIHFLANTTIALEASYDSLQPATTYRFAVRAVCDSAAGRYSEWSDTAVLTTPEPPVVPEPECLSPSQLTVSNVTTTMATLSWVNGGEETRWEITYNGQTSAFGSNPATLVGLTPSTRYSVAVRAICDDEHSSEWSEAVVFTTLDEQQPEGIDDVVATSIRLHPNPATTSVTLEGIEGNATVTIVDMNGRAVYTTGMQASCLQIDLTGLAQGAYFVRIETEQTTAIRKLIVR